METCQQNAARYYMLGNKLIRRSYSGPHLTCIKYPQTLEVLYKIHDDECGNHSGGRSLAHKALNIGYFWPTMRHDSAEYVKKCDCCQRYKPIPNLPTEVYHPQNSPWPFMQWAIDLVGPLPPAPAKKEMMIVATDYFTKWIEAEALSSTKEADVERFIWRNIICREKERRRRRRNLGRIFLWGNLLPQYSYSMASSLCFRQLELLSFDIGIFMMTVLLEKLDIVISGLVCLK
ncbi:hypothetical protein L3X38_035296 [Prunus dulcis]|uniref:Integrase zinc-binding domain-containing protein n=1 Tax=Prunus dulcis TaxID=3755 RepID=A0AAD4VLY0_PRUDU|nr:hypothetical protein L3X38_035296 [Prunus dulcis]